jgi:uncharacterized protein YidB (DUF937 family)
VKRLLMIGAAVAVLGLAALAVGGAVTSAQDGSGPVNTFLAKVAEKLGVSQDKLNTAVQDAQTEMIDEAVASGQLTQEQADKLKERAAEGGFVFPFAGPGHGWGESRGVVPEAAAQVLGMTEDELLQQLKDGNSLAQVADAQGMSAQDFQTALLKQVKTQLDGLVGDGTLTQAQADEQYQRTEQNIDSIVNGTGCAGEFGGRRGGPGRFGEPWSGPPTEETPQGTGASGVTS